MPIFQYSHDSNTPQRRQNQNREAQRVFRQRQRERFEELEKELQALRTNYEGLNARHENLKLLYMDLLKRKDMEKEKMMGEVSARQSLVGDFLVEGNLDMEWLFPLTPS